MAAGVAPARTNRPAPATATRPSSTGSGTSSAWFTPVAATSITAPPRMPRPMIAVLAMSLKRPPQ